MRETETLPSREAKPFFRIDVTLWYTSTILISSAKLKLRAVEALISSESKPFCRLFIVLRHTFAEVVMHPQTVLRFGDETMLRIGHAIGK